jgi:hypothetical protein
MIKWARKQDGKDIVSEERMFLAIKETWYGEFCFICKTHDCNITCPLTLNNQYCCGDNALWMKMWEAKTWSEWIKAAEKFLAFIEKIKPLEYQMFELEKK